MPKFISLSPSLVEGLVARITEATYREALKRGVHGSFLDFELALWRNIRETVNDELRDIRESVITDSAVGLQLVMADIA